jgi:hypothetical protein
MNSLHILPRRLKDGSLKEQCHEIFDFSFFIPLGQFQILFKSCGDIHSSRCTTGVVDSGGKWKKVFKLKYFNYFVWTPLGSRVNIDINVCLQVHFKMSEA